MRGHMWLNKVASVLGPLLRRLQVMSLIRVVESESGVGVGGVACFQLESESGVGVGFSKLLESESGVGVGFSKLLESESGVGTFVAITDSNVY